MRSASTSSSASSRSRASFARCTACCQRCCARRGPDAASSCRAATAPRPRSYAMPTCASPIRCSRFARMSPAAASCRARRRRPMRRRTPMPRTSPTCAGNAAWKTRAFRAPHHTASGVALVGGGSLPRPGEISLAHHGVLFLDELPEFDRRVLDVLREPLESGRIAISRAARQAEFPARFQLVAAMNPCPCGYAGDPSGRCRCTPDAIQRYRSRVSGPLLDRIDLKLEVPRVAQAELRATSPGESSADVRARVIAARGRQIARAGKPNAVLTNREADRCCVLDPRSHALIDRAIERLGLSARAYHRVLRVARTIADLDGAERLAAEHVSESIQYRRLDFA